MIKNLVYLFLFTVVLYACKSKSKTLVGTWHAVKLENPEMDSFFTNSQNYIDSIGKGNSDSTNMAIYGVTNMDSLRRVLQGQYDTAKSMQVNAVTNTTFRFRQDSIAILTFNGVVDSARWYIGTDNKLVLDDLHGENPAQKVAMEILKLSDMVLKLRFMEDSTISTVTFRREGN
jgi:hypothetical protein